MGSLKESEFLMRSRQVVTKSDPEVLDNLQIVASKIGAKIVILKSRGKEIGQFTFKSGRRFYFLPFSLDINPVGAATLARDKDFATRFLAKMGYPVVEGKAFVLPQSSTTHLKKTIDRAYRYAQQLGDLVVVKPNSGSLGRGVWVVNTNRSSLQRALKDAFNHDDTVLVQGYVRGRNYRIVVYNDTIIIAGEQTPLSIIGDGNKTVAQLLRKKTEGASSQRKHIEN
jgi:predicted RNA-binding protein YlxR (DUF448 family)